MKVLAIGAHGLLGTAFRDTAPTDVTLIAPPHRELDLTDADAVARALDQAEPAWVVNCAAFTAVDAAEQDPEAAARLNADAVGALGRLAAARGVRVLLPGTDYLFAGESTRPYREDDLPQPRSVYARTKWEGEQLLQASGARALIVRSGWLFGRGGRNFPATMWARARAHTPSAVVDDQRGAPTAALDLAEWCWRLIGRGDDGVVHATNAGSATWFEVAQAAYAAAAWPEGVTVTTTAAFGARANRPRYSVLDCSRFDERCPGGRRDWREALAQYLGTLGAERAA
ncbi:MAG: dTDP-4-dehydrorhamnose reductase [Gemmatimonadaceae bacterium]